MKITIFGEPLSKARPRSFIKKGKIRHYDPLYVEKGIIKQKILKSFQEIITDKSNIQYQEAVNLTKATFFYVTLNIYTRHPKSFNTSKINLSEWGVLRPVGKKDIDNIAKMYLDCANRILYPDDHLIVDQEAHAWYSSYPRLEFNVTGCKKISSTSEVVLGLYSVADVMCLVNKASDLDHYFSSLQKNEDWENLVEVLCKIAEEHAEKLMKIKKILKKKGKNSE